VVSLSERRDIWNGENPVKTPPTFIIAVVLTQTDRKQIIFRQ
jgi:hypothetical protein